MASFASLLLVFNSLKGSPKCFCSPGRRGLLECVPAEASVHTSSLAAISAAGLLAPAGGGCVPPARVGACQRCASALEHIRHLSATAALGGNGSVTRSRHPSACIPCPLLRSLVPSCCWGLCCGPRCTQVSVKQFQILLRRGLKKGCRKEKKNILKSGDASC